MMRPHRVVEGREVGRIRGIVRLASDQVSGRARQWLLRDERGTWECRARELLESVAEKANELGVGDAETDAQVATVLALAAAEATLRESHNPP